MCVKGDGGDGSVSVSTYVEQLRTDLIQQAVDERRSWLESQFKGLLHRKTKNGKPSVVDIARFLEFPIAHPQGGWIGKEDLTPNIIETLIGDPVARTDEQRNQCTQKCISMWLLVCRDLWCHKLALRPDAPFVVLFHCFGGRNRGPAMACAWLIVAYGYTAEEAVEYILWERRGTWPWRRRDYVLWAFKILEDARAEIVDYFHSKHTAS